MNHVILKYLLCNLKLEVTLLNQAQENVINQLLDD